MRRPTTFAALFLLLAMFPASSAGIGEASIFRDLDGEPAQLESHIGNGQWLVVMIWASDCAICNKEAAAYDSFHRSQNGSGTAVLGVSMDGTEKSAAARAFIERHDLSFPNIIGEPGMVGLYYQAATGEPLRGTPSFLIYDPSGKLAAAQAGAVPPESVQRFVVRNRARGTAN